MLQVVFPASDPGSGCDIAFVYATVGESGSILLIRRIGAVVLRQQLAAELRAPDIVVVVIDTYAYRSAAKIGLRA